MSVGPDVNPGDGILQRKPNPGGMACFKILRNKHVIPPGLFWVVGTSIPALTCRATDISTLTGFYPPKAGVLKRYAGSFLSFNPVGYV
jgi:hypothetical protein